jgi:polyhydroxyalkanoate synthesis regulator protein
VFVRYQNRRLYDTESASYVPFDAILNLRAGSFVVVYCPTGQDITGWCIEAARHERDGQLLRARWRNIEQSSKRT